MPTTYPHRIHWIIPAAQRDAFLAPYCAKIDQHETLDKAIRDKDGKIVAYEINTALTEEHNTISHEIYASLGGVAKDVEFDKRSPSSKREWFAEKAAVTKAAGLLAVACDNAGVWPEPEVALEEMGLKTQLTTKQDK